MAKSKDKIIVKMQSQESSHFYTTYKNRKNKEKMVLRRFDPTLNKHVEYREEKIK